MSSSSASSTEGNSSTSQTNKGWGGYGRFVPVVGQYWHETSTLGEAKKTFVQAQEVFKNPEHFFEGAVRGIKNGMTEEQKGGEKKKTTLFDHVSNLVKDGVSAISAVGLEQLLEHSETYDLDEKDKDLKKKALEILKKAKAENKSLTDTAKTVWDQLKKYHIIMGGINLNIKASSNEAMRERRAEIEGKANDGVSPIHSLVRCQEEWRTLRIRHELPDPPPRPLATPGIKNPIHQPLSANELENLKQMEQKTDGMVHAFSRKTLHFTTMYTIHYLFNHNIDPALYKKALTKGGDIKKRYLKRFEKGSIRYYFYKLVYSLILWFIRPILEPVIPQVIIHLRTFLKKDVDLLNLIEQKVVDMKNYYGRIEKARTDFLTPGRNDEAGSFDEYLEQSIKVYGGKFTEADLVTIFTEYIVQNFVPRPKVAIRGHRIPLLSTFLEWIIHAIRKAIVRRVLTKAGIVEKILTDGGSSIHYAQLGIKRLLEKKFTQIVEMIDRYRSRSVEQASAEKMELEAKKAQIISRRLHLTIQQHSQKLLRFIDIEASNSDERKLRDLDNRVSQLVMETIRAVADLVKWEPFSVEAVLEDATTNIMETSLVSVFEGKEVQIETQLQTIIDILDKSYAYIPEDKRDEIELAYRNDCTLVDENLNSLQEQLARSAVATALETKLKNISGEKHNAIKNYVNKEQVAHNKFAETLADHEMKLDALTAGPFYYDGAQGRTTQLKAQLGETVAMIDRYLRHLSMQLRSPQLEECYTDVRGDLHNIYAAVIATVNQLNKEMETIATKTNQIRTDELELIGAEKCHKLLREFSLDLSSDDAKKTLTSLSGASPKSLEAQIKEINQKLLVACREHEKTVKTLSVFDDYLQMKKFDSFEKQVEDLANHIRAYQDLRVNRKFPTKEEVDTERKRIVAEIKKLYKEIKSNPDANIQEHILPFFEKAADTDTLYQLFYSSIFRNRIPIFSKLAKMKVFYQKKIEILAEELKKTNGELPNREVLEKQKQELEHEVKQQREAISQLLQKNTQEKTKKIEQNLSEITPALKKGFNAADAALKHINKQFGVKGCVSVGELKLYKTLAPELTARVAPEIIKGTRTLIDAMGKPFHYKQMVLRLMFLDIARRQQST